MALEPGTHLPSLKSKPYLLDLTGKSKRKARPYQLYQAYSIRYWQPLESPVRRELVEFWEKRHEESVRSLLRPFLKDAVESSPSKSERLVFHMAFMRWKVDSLTPEELDELHSWIKEQQELKEQANQLPLSQEAEEYGDPLFAENSHIQRYVV